MSELKRFDYHPVQWGEMEKDYREDGDFVDADNAIEVISALQAENERLIFALERVKSNTMYGKNFPDLEDYKQAANRAHEIAKTALTNSPID